MIQTKAPEHTAAMIQSALRSPDQMMKTGARVLCNICSLLASIPEMLLYPRSGSRYNNLLIFLMALGLFQPVNIASGVFAGRAGYIGSAIMMLAVWAGSIYHGIRIWRLKLHPEMEVDSEIENDPLIKLSDSWAIQRIFIEPSMVVVAAFVLKLVGIVGMIMMLYLLLAAFALSLKSIIVWDQSVDAVRDVLDRQGRLPVLQRIAEGKPVKAIGRFNLSGIPTATPAATKAAIASSLTGLTPDMEKLLSPVES